MTTNRSVLTAVLVMSLLGSCRTAIAPGVDGPRIVGADREPQNWLSHGRTYSEQRFSALAKINTGNVGQLGLAWWHDMISFSHFLKADDVEAIRAYAIQEAHREEKRLANPQ